MIIELPAGLWVKGGSGLADWALEGFMRPSADSSHLAQGGSKATPWPAPAFTSIVHRDPWASRSTTQACPVGPRQRSVRWTRHLPWSMEVRPRTADHIKRSAEGYTRHLRARTCSQALCFVRWEIWCSIIMMLGLDWEVCWHSEVDGCIYYNLCFLIFPCLDPLFQNHGFDLKTSKMGWPGQHHCPDPGWWCLGALLHFQEYLRWKFERQMRGRVSLTLSHPVTHPARAFLEGCELVYHITHSTHCNYDI